ncbi:MAG TPA: hypothetical protein VEI01_25330 [Terriglobales bacterium]|nr:hypothetical protein [Terriglobales bacterium]
MEWNAVLFLGAYHGINPGMGWLFAVALGMQHGSARGVWRALPPIALGHMAAVGAVLLAAGLAQMVVPLSVMKVVVASVLVAFGLYRMWRHRHPRFGGMRVGFRDLTVWSFLMASAHGAGLMVLPFVMAMSDRVLAAGGSHSHHAAASSARVPWVGALALSLHTAAYLLVLVFVAWIVYRKLGLALLRTAWFNLDWLWAGALVATGAVVLLS